MLLGLTWMPKSDIFAETDTWFGVMLLGAFATTFPPLNGAAPPLGLAVGVNTMVTVAVEPDCSDWILQDTLVEVEPPPQVPEVALAETKVRGIAVVDGLMSSVTVMFEAKSGPLLVRM